MAAVCPSPPSPPIPGHLSTQLQLAALVSDTVSQTPCTGLRRHSSNDCKNVYAIGSRKLSASEQFFVCAQTVVSLLQTTQIRSDFCFITDPVGQLK